MRTWNTTGLYKASRDRMPAKRPRRIRATPPRAVLVPVVNEPACERCGFPTNFNGHRLLCLTSTTNPRGD